MPAGLSSPSSRCHRLHVYVGYHAQKNREENMFFLFCTFGLYCNIVPFGMIKMNDAPRYVVTTWSILIIILFNFWPLFLVFYALKWYSRKVHVTSNCYAFAYSNGFFDLSIRNFNLHVNMRTGSQLFRYNIILIQTFLLCSLANLCMLVRKRHLDGVLCVLPLLL